jgi:hypothetical protein
MLGVGEKRSRLFLVAVPAMITPRRLRRLGVIIALKLTPVVAALTRLQHYAFFQAVISADAT